MSKQAKRLKQGPWNRKDRGGGSMGDPGGSALAQWRNGIILPLIPVVLGLFPLISGHFESIVRVRGKMIVLDGPPARLLGVAAIAFGACLHIHYFWEGHETLAEFSQPVLIVAGLVFLTAIGFLFYFSIS